MNILLVSQCSKRALVETRRILDQFAERTGDRTWVTPITQNGLNTLRKLLRKTARRNTAVACHWLKSSGPELYWIVGNARAFNAQGKVATNTTRRDILRSQDENHWHTGEAMALLAGIAGLFHDFGKANQLFQDKLSGKNKTGYEPIRHEWLSLWLFRAFVAERADPLWLADLAAVEPDRNQSLLAQFAAQLADDPSTTLIGHDPLQDLPPVAQAIGWLIVSHHRLPQHSTSDHNLRRAPRVSELKLNTNQLTANWNSPQCDLPDWQPSYWQQLITLPFGTPLASQTWCQKANQLARRALQCPALNRNESWLLDPFTSHLARLALMLADHVYSSGSATLRWQDQRYLAYANTEKLSNGKRVLKQTLDEHNIGVGQNAYLLAKSLPKLQRYLPAITRHKGFKQRTKLAAYRWQDQAYDLAVSLAHPSQQQGFFGVNMASTGCGKTFANARIMYGLADEAQGCRFSVALGLRTLTLQTGDALRERLKLDEDDLAVLIGSSAVTQLHQQNQHDKQQKQRALQQVELLSAPSGSESEQDLVSFSEYVRYDGALEDGPLNRWLQNSSKLRQLLSAPVLVSTIDQLIPATEGTRGGKQIAPMLRLLTSDLVLDEPDDFGLDDLPALCRLVNWAGMLGSRVLLSSATLPPALIRALFTAYQAGRAHYHQARGEQPAIPPICCAWFDEFGVRADQISEPEQFKTTHAEFISQRLQKLQTPTPLRLGQLLILPTVANDPHAACAAMANTLAQAMHNLHQQHHQRHSSGKCVSIGLVRLANINPLVAVVQQLTSQAPADDLRLHFCVYHSQHPLIVRSNIEQQLDQVLTRTDSEVIWQHPRVQQALQQHETHHLFVVFASPVAEVGRDHDYDWAIAELSSMRSLIQLAGRIQRHRKQAPKTPNLLILNRNFRALSGKLPAYCQPGFEAKDAKISFVLANPDLQISLPESCYRTISAAPSIQAPKVRLNEKDQRLDVLEHMHLQARLFGLPPLQIDDELFGKPIASLWWQCAPHWSGEMQRQSRFRASAPQQLYVLYQDDEHEPLRFHRLEEDGQLTLTDQNDFDRIELQLADRVEPWLSHDPEQLLQQQAERSEWEIHQTCRIFAQLSLRQRENNSNQAWHYHPLLGVHQRLK